MDFTLQALSPCLNSLHLDFTLQALSTCPNFEKMSLPTGACSAGVSAMASQISVVASQASEQLDAAEGRAQALRRRTRDACDGAVVARLPSACEWTANVDS